MKKKYIVWVFALLATFILAVTFFLINSSGEHSIMSVVNDAGAIEILQIEILNSQNGQKVIIEKSNKEFNTIMTIFDNTILSKRTKSQDWIGSEFSVKFVGENNVNILLTHKKCNIEGQLYDIEQPNDIKRIYNCFT